VDVALIPPAILYLSRLSFFDICYLNAIYLAYYESSGRSGVWTVHLRSELAKGLVFVQFTKLNLITMGANNGDGQYPCQFVTRLCLRVADKN
jgi:hypothetical protein